MNLIAEEQYTFMVSGQIVEGIVITRESYLGMMMSNLDNGSNTDDLLKILEDNIVDVDNNIYLKDVIIDSKINLKLFIINENKISGYQPFLKLITKV